jgi:cell division protein FtsI/penicillin-binding protein 2
MPNRAKVLPVLLIVALSTAGCSLFGSSGKPSATPPPSVPAGATADSTVSAFLQAWQANWAGAKNTDTLTTLTGDAAFTTRLASAGTTMGVSKVALTPQGAPVCSPSTSCQSNVAVDVTLTGIGDASWVSPVVVKQAADGVWALDPSPSTIHPDLTSGNRIRRVRELPARAPILDRSGRKLAWSQPIVRVGLEAGKSDAAAAKKLAGIVGTDPATLAKTLAGSAKGQFVEAIVLRKAEYASVASRIGTVKGITLQDDVRALAPTAAFARGVLGTVAPATKETLRNAGDTAEAADEVGSFGLQYAYQKQLAGTPTTAVRIVDTATGKVVTTIASAKGTPGKPLTTTLDYTVQKAAESAVAASTDHKASMVVTQPSTGQILAVANGPGSRNDNPAMTGHYAPGSTFKIVTSSALLEAGLTADSSVPCTTSINVDGRKFVNYDALPVTGTMSLRRAFELSCNTAFISQREKVAGSALHDMAATYGIGSTTWDLPVDAFSGSVPTPATATELAASMIGQGKIIASPLAMAEVVAAVKSGAANAPTLVKGASNGSATPLPSATVTAVRSMMRSTVTNGTGAVLAGQGDVGAKTGTAEIGTKTNAWMVGFRGDLAFAVVVEGGASGGHDAGPLAKTLLSNVPR